MTHRKRLHIAPYWTGAGSDSLHPLNPLTTNLSRVKISDMIDRNQMRCFELARTDPLFSPRANLFTTSIKLQDLIAAAIRHETTPFESIATPNGLKPVQVSSSLPL